jgi:hypothetical protein
LIDAYMATFRLRGATWRAEVNKDGVRASSSFATREEAEAWAHEYEALCAEFPPAESLALRALPQKVGAVYFLYDENNQLLYVGATSDLHKRLIRHRENGIIKFASSAHILCNDHVRRLQIESHYLERYQPPHNKEGTERGKRSVPQEFPAAMQTS